MKFLRRFLFFFLIIVVVYYANAFLNPIPKRRGAFEYRPLYGTSYSFEQASWYGLNPREEYLKVIGDYKFDWIRLPFFWNQMIDEHGKLNINDLEFAIAEARKRNVKVLVALGAKTPYYPEYHLPENIKNGLVYGQEIDLNSPVSSEILRTTQEVVKKLSRYDNISHWQVENEPLVGNVNRWKMSLELVRAEVDVVRKADFQKRPIILNHAATGFYDNSWKELLSILEPGDVFGVNAYFKTQGINILDFKSAGREVKLKWPKSFTWPVQSWTFISPSFENIKEEVEKKDVNLWVLEMQAEPYIRDESYFSRTDFPFKTQDIVKGNEFLKSYGIESIGLWGVHFWQFSEQRSDNSWVSTVKDIVN